MKRVVYAIVWMLFFFPFCSMKAQSALPHKWTLKECIDHAVQHNITIKQQEQAYQKSEVDLHTSKYSWLPNLNAGIGQNFDFGRSPSKDGIIVDNNSSNTSAMVQLSMPLFDGLKTPNEIASKKSDVEVAAANLEKAKEDLSVNVASYYIQVLYNEELLKVANLQVELTESQMSKTETMVKNGKVPESQLYDIRAQLATDVASQTEANNNYKLAMLDLIQSLELNLPLDSFDIEKPELKDVVRMNMGSLLPPENTYSNAVVFKPQIKAEEFRLKSSQKMLKVARSSYFPQLSFNANYSNGYYHYSKGIGTASNVPFGDQLSRNGRKTIGFSLSIPIFNRFQVRNSVRNAKIAILNQSLALENAKKNLYKEIQQAYFNATAAHNRYLALEKSVEAALEAFQYAEKKYASGKSSVYEFNEAKIKYAQSLAQRAHAKYNYILRAKILDFYNGKPIEL